MDAPRRRLRGPDANRLLGPHAAWDRIQMDMEKIYALGGRLEADDLPLVPELMALLDTDGNARISAKEYPRLNDAPPHVRISLALGNPAPTPSGQESSSVESTQESVEEESQSPRLPLLLVEVTPAAQALGVTAHSRGERLYLDVPGMWITFAVNDTIATVDFEVQAQQALIMFDGDKNGYLEASELPEGAQTQFGRFEAVDTDEDGKVYAGEIIHYLSHQQAALRSQIHAKAEDVQDALFPLLDEDRDGRLLGKEIETAEQRLLAFDKNGDGQIDPDELPGGMLVVFARGSLENRDLLFQPPAVMPPRSIDGIPRWFARMDENNDGYISPREFLSDRDQFLQLDDDGDGFISPQEIE
jgi:Ca2+-binding EF-hand superfamily protein